MAETAFSEDGKYYSAITSDGRLRIWDTETNVLKQEYTPDLHLTSPPSCLQWITLSQSSTKQNTGRRNSINQEESQCIAIGTSSGKILIYSVAQAKVETVLLHKKHVNAGYVKVTSLDWNRKYGLYSSNKDNIVHEWDLQNSSPKYKYNVNIEGSTKQGNTVNAIKIVPHNQEATATFLVTASWQVRLWRLQNGDATVLKALGHNATQTALLTLATVKDVSWLIEGSQNERLLSFWDVTITSDHIPPQNGNESGKKRKRKKSLTQPPTILTPTYNFVLEDAPRSVDVDLVQDETGTKLCLSAATRSGVLHYYGTMLNGSSTKPIKPSVTIQVTTPDANPLPLHCCRVHSGDLLIGYSRGPTMIFEKVTPDLKTRTQILIRGEGKEHKKKQKQTNEVNKVRSSTNVKEVNYLEPMGGSVSRKRVTPGAGVEVPMEARLANLSLDIKSRSKSAVNQNLTKLLMQGLHSKDNGIIQTVLQNDDANVAQRTVANLPADYVPQLLEQLVEMSTRKTSQCASVCTWLTAVLRSHSALLLATVGTQQSNHLAHLLAVFMQRRSHLCQLLNLKGRLELTIKQRSLATQPQENQEAILEYNDTSSDEEMQVEQYQSDSAQSWDDKLDESAESGNERDDDENGIGDESSDDDDDGD
ncbi:hypothetical protein K1T71_013813 [Dendrolimus kikuchii]|uniref:Uncharacterized protein n=1 Tax=Dendrolimus kikuchii TaxID=765133 RepID=A0ACC1CG28_9NEOP|nr:hypothetical protein K1T71_013813 [Dendrolimus kikuchii]